MKRDPRKEKYKVSLPIKEKKSISEPINKLMNEDSSSENEEDLMKLIQLSKTEKLKYSYDLKSYIEKIQDPNIRLDINGKKIPLLFLLCEISDIKCIMEILKKENLEVNIEDDDKRNALFYLNGNEDDSKIIDELIKKKIEINHKDRSGNTALEHIIINRLEPILIYHLLNITETNENFMEKLFKILTKNLKDYSNEVSKGNQELNEVVENIHEILNEKVRNKMGTSYNVEIYGSRATGISLPESDIDFVIKSPANEINFTTILEIIYKELENDKTFVSEIKFIFNTDVPIIKLKTTDKYKELAIDISMDSHQGPKCVGYIKEKLEYYEHLRSLILVLKKIFYIAKLNIPHEGGLSSYGIILLIIYFLEKKKPAPYTVSDNNEAKLGKLFFEFLVFYGNKRNYNNHKKLENIEISADFNNNSLTITDPLLDSNNVAKNVRELNKIINVFRNSLKIILKSCECNCGENHKYCINENDNKDLLNILFTSDLLNLNI